MTNKTHVHKYLRSKLGKLIIFKCMIPGCAHYIRKELAENRFSLCWRCNEIFVMTKVQLLLKKPHCLTCTKGKNTDRLKQLLDAGDLMEMLK